MGTTAAPAPMKVIKIRTNTTLKFLSVFNGIFELTDSELRVLASLIDNKETVNLCSIANKQKVAKELKIKDFNTLNNYVKKLKDKKAIVMTPDGYALTELLKTRHIAIEIIPEQ